MFTKVAIVALASSVLVAATKTVSYGPPKPTPIPISQCNTGAAQCCNSAEQATSPAAAQQLGLLGVVVQGVDVLVGLGCTPLSIAVLGDGVSCAQKPLCCQNNNFNGLINIGCSPITL